MFGRQLKTDIAWLSTVPNIELAIYLQTHPSVV